jgi:hypothetical protein
VGGYRHGSVLYHLAGEDGQEKVVLLATACGEVDEVAQRVSFLEGELVVVCRAWDATEEKL